MFGFLLFPVSLFYFLSLSLVLTILSIQDPFMTRETQLKWKRKVHVNCRQVQCFVPSPKGYNNLQEGKGHNFGIPVTLTNFFMYLPSYSLNALLNFGSIAGWLHTHTHVHTYSHVYTLTHKVRRSGLERKMGISSASPLKQQWRGQLFSRWRISCF